MEEIIFGKNSVLEALRKRGGKFREIIVAADPCRPKIKEILDLSRGYGLKIIARDKNFLDKITGGRNHQGIAGIISPYRYASLEDIIEKWKDSGEKALILVLDEILDTQNLGAIIRSSNALGAHGIIVPKHRQAPITSIVAKISSGALEHTLVARVTNLSQALRYLKKLGIWIVETGIGLKDSITDFDFRRDLAIVIGNEAKGVRPSVKKEADFFLSIPLRGEIDSLNASVATGVFLYEARRQRDQSS